MIVVGLQSNTWRTRGFGAIDTTGNLVIDTVYDDLGAFSEGLAPVKINGQYGYLSKKGELAIPAIYEYADLFVDGLAKVTVKQANGRKKSGMIDPTGKFVVEPEYDLVEEFKDGKAIAIDLHLQNKATFHLIDRTGRRLASDISSDTLCDRDPTGPWHAENLTVRKSADGKCFYTDASGHNGIAREFERAWPFSDGLAVVWVKAGEAFGTKSGKRQFAGVIDENGTFIVPPVFDEARIDTPGVIRVRWRDQRDEYLDRAGHPLTFSGEELAKYIEEMRDYFAPSARDPNRIIAARVADDEYYFSLPKGFCVLDKANAADARVIDGTRNQPSAAAQAPTSATISGSFALCDELQNYRATGDRLMLKHFGIATGLRRGEQDPTAASGIVYISRMICGKLRGGGPAGFRQQTEQQRSERIAEGWKQVSSGTPVRLGAIDDQPFGCTSVALAPDGRGAVAANITTIAFLPDWSITVFNAAAPGSKDQLVELIGRETESINAITQAAMDAMKLEAR